eukprot:scaffold95833_cov65-Phaeocystis_antarctica.AAC.3
MPALGLGLGSGLGLGLELGLGLRLRSAEECLWGAALALEALGVLVAEDCLHHRLRLIDR